MIIYSGIKIIEELSSCREVLVAASVLCGLSASNHKSIRLDSLTFGDVALFLIIYRILQRLYMRSNKGANGLPSF